MPVIAVGVPVGVPAQVGTYKNPSVAVVARAALAPATMLPAEVIRILSVEFVKITTGYAPVAKIARAYAVP